MDVGLYHTQDGVDDVDKDMASAISIQKGEEGTMEMGEKKSASGCPPKASAILLQVFQRRIESIIINSATFPPGFVFVQ